MRRALVVGAVLAFPVLFAAPAARATGVMEFPDNGSEQEGRGGAWVARASDPLAVFYNPAGLAGQPTRVTLQANVSEQNTCFTRVMAANDPTQDNGPGPGGTYPKVCQDTSFFPDPQIGFTYRLTDRIGLGIAILGPSAVGNVSWPEFLNATTPSPQRYLLISSNVVLLTPTIGIGAEVVDNLRLGASFIAGTAPTIDFVNAAPALNSTSAVQASGNDVRNELKAKDLFIPGFTGGVLWSPTDSIDVAGWYKWMASVDAKGDVQTQSNYFTPAVYNGNKSNVVYGDTSLPDCNQGNGSTTCGSGNNASIKVPLPMEAKIGVRYHIRRADAPPAAHVRDPMGQDLFDVEANFTWANDSAFDYLQIRFPGDANGAGILPANPGIPGGVLPPNADVRHNFKDVFGVRLGGDYNLLPDQLAIRAGGFFETSAADTTYQNIDFDAAARIGLALGGSYRIKFGAEKRQALDLMLAYGHVFFATLKNTDPNAQGLPALTGEACPNSNTPPFNCPAPYRTPWPVNLGTITSEINVINVGASYRF